MTVDLDALWRVAEVQPPVVGGVRTHITGSRTAFGDILIAANADDTRSILFPSNEAEAFAPDLTTKVHLTRRTLGSRGLESTFVAVSCTVQRLHPVFTTLARDMLDAAAGSTNPGAVVRKVLDEWRDLLSGDRRESLSRGKIIGLMAELLTLRDVLLRDPKRDVSVWTGPDQALHDIRRAGHALEVKGTLVREALVVEIHGLRQLEPPPQGDLHLILHRFEEVPDGELTIAGIVREIIDLAIARREFVDRLSRAGYDMADEGRYERLRFRHVEQRMYPVEDLFPRLIPASLVAGDVPAGVVLVSYSVDLTGAWPAPLSLHRAEQVLASVGRAT